MPRSGHSEHPAGVRHQFGMLSAFSVEHCPPSRWNTVRHQHGIVSAIAWNTQVAPQTQYALQPPGRSRLVSDWSGTVAASQTRSGVRVLSKMVPDVTVPLGTGMSGTSGGCGWRGTNHQHCHNAGRRSLGASAAFQERLAGLFGGKPVKKFVPGARVVPSRSWRWHLGFHPAILAPLELNRYPFAFVQYPCQPLPSPSSTTHATPNARCSTKR
jgi:hypothetical protein